MVPIDHARLHARDFGGKPEDYIALDEYLDQTKFHLTEWQHRAFLHNTLGIKICEDIFGRTIRNSDNNDIPVRELARRHIMEDLGYVPNIKEWIGILSGRVNAKWHNNPSKSDIRWLEENYYSVDKKKNE